MPQQQVMLLIIVLFQKHHTKAYYIEAYYCNSDPCLVSVHATAKFDILPKNKLSAGKKTEGVKPLNFMQLTCASCKEGTTLAVTIHVFPGSSIPSYLLICQKTSYTLQS
jgi:hypothetical protein